MIARDNRLRRGWEVEQTRATGRSVSNRRMVLISRPNDLGRTRFGVAAGKRLGNAVRRNRAKRLMREALRLSAPGVAPGYDIFVIARGGLRPEDRLADIQKDLRYLLRRAGLDVPIASAAPTAPTQSAAPDAPAGAGAGATQQAAEPEGGA